MEIQITRWRDLPSLVAVREGTDQTKAPLAQRFQEAIDEAAMRLGAVGSDAYLDGWVRSDWTPVPDELADLDRVAVADAVVARLEAEWSEEAVAAYLDRLGEPTGEQQ